MTIFQTKFTENEMIAANIRWGFNCGPAAIAAIFGMTIEEVRPYLGDFESKGYTNPTLMFSIIKSIADEWEIVKPAAFPKYGLARIQWHGPWMNEGVPIRARYRQSHWVGVCQKTSSDIGIFDANAMANGTGWISLKNWQTVVVPMITSEIKKADGKWSITHGIEITKIRSALTWPKQ